MPAVFSPRRLRWRLHHQREPPQPAATPGSRLAGGSAATPPGWAAARTVRGGRPGRGDLLRHHSVPAVVRPYRASRAVLQQAFPPDRDNPLAAGVIRPRPCPPTPPCISTTPATRMAI